MRGARELAVAASTGVVAGALAATILGAPPVWAVAIALPAAAVAFLAARLVGAATPTWSAPDAVRPTGLSIAATLTSRIGDAGRDQHRYVTQLRPRLQRIALASLRTRPELADLTELYDPRARDALGVELHTLLTARLAPLPPPERTAQLLALLEDL